MSKSPQLQLHNMQRSVVERPLVSSVPKSVVPLKRSGGEDDDIQFISSNPVKRQKNDEHAQYPTPQQHEVPTLSVAPTFPIAVPPIELRDSDRRISTGMVGLPSDINAIELASALRGVSLPVLEKFVLDQPLRKPRPLSPPELSPKQLPRTIVPSMLSTSAVENDTGSSGLQTAPVACMKTDEDSAAPAAPPQTSPTPSSAADELQVPNASISQVKSSSPSLAKSRKEGDPGRLAMPPPPLLRTERSATPKATSPADSIHNTPRSDLAKHPCHICARMQQQANLAKAHGLPMLHHNMPHPMIPQIACHPPYSQHLHSQMLSMGPNSIHPFTPGFSPIMMPIHGSNLATLPPHMASPVQMDQQGNDEKSQEQPEKSGDQTQPSPAPTVAAAESPTAPDPVKPPASLIQPTYRKPSPNLIVDIAETCQEKFPFEEVAKRHNVPVQKVFDVFAAIIQVPLLRCPTDRRRAGRLATTRVREYTKTKKAIQETGGQKNTEAKEEVVVKPLDVANRLGQVDFPDGFNLGEQS
ncbi:hypothetical protein F5Y06DRAFT_232347 [Hypoxylon sp. FL0890]|nr:hypothetical protein F5Y06DRAFT_232347 [Hypoxylon sp. FL0890]